MSNKPTEKSVEVVVWADQTYRYRVEAADVPRVTYEEDGREDKTELSFGSIHEMEETARAMLFVCQAARELGINY